MVTREALKNEIDNVQAQYLGVLFKIIKTFEIPDESQDIVEIENEPRNSLLEFFENSPLYDSGIELERNRDLGREVRL